MAVPVRPLNAQLAFGEIHVTPLKTDHFSATEPRFAPKEHDQVGQGIEGFRRFDELFLFIEVIKAHRRFRDPQVPDGARQLIDHVPLHSLL